MIDASTMAQAQEINKIAKQPDREPDGIVSSAPECAVCLQPCIYPACLPCNHVFCYLCVKGVANQSKRCPMCRQEIPADFLERPQLVEIDKAQQEDTETASDESSDEYQWYYEGRNGWWQYDQRTSLELEAAYKQGKRSCELLIAGFLYVADFTLMLQSRRNDNSRKRRIKRDLCSAPKKGIAGLRLNNPVDREHEEQQQNVTREIRGAERSASPANDDIGDGTNAPIPPSNTPQTPAGGAESGDTTPSTSSTLFDHQRSDSLHQIRRQYPGCIRRPVQPIHQMRNTHKRIVIRFLTGSNNSEIQVIRRYN